MTTPVDVVKGEIKQYQEPVSSYSTSNGPIYEDEYWGQFGMGYGYPSRNNGNSASQYYDILERAKKDAIAKGFYIGRTVKRKFGHMGDQKGRVFAFESSVGKGFNSNGEAQPITVKWDGVGPHSYTCNYTVDELLIVEEEKNAD